MELGKLRKRLNARGQPQPDRQLFIQSRHRRTTGKWPFNHLTTARDEQYQPRPLYLIRHKQKHLSRSLKVFLDGTTGQTIQLQPKCITQGFLLHQPAFSAASNAILRNTFNGMCDELKTRIKTDPSLIASKCYRTAVYAHIAAIVFAKILLFLLRRMPKID